MDIQQFPIKREVLDQLTDRNFSDIKRLYWHHSVETDGHDGPYNKLAAEMKADIAYLKNMQADQANSIGAICIAYSFIIMEDGIVWKLRPNLKVPASQIGDNTAGLSVCVDGDFTKHLPNKTQMDVCKELGVYLDKKFDFEQILGHRDVAAMYPNNPGYYSTACPGTDFYNNFLPELRSYILAARK
jgi:hypothetical protein